MEQMPGHRRILLTRLVLLTGLAVLSVIEVAGQPYDPAPAWNVAKQHLRNSLAEYRYAFLFPRSVDPDGKVIRVPSRDWTSGFYAGCLWLMYAQSRDGSFLKAARKWSVGLEKEQHNTTTHDLGMMLYTPLGHGYRLLNHDEKYRDILMDAARSLSTRFNARTGCLRSWDHGSWEFPVIIDNMINLELLFWATKTSGDSSFYQIAISHADKTLEHHFRDDHSSYHVVNYDTTTGKVISKGTHQGYSDASAWARGQAWGLYGFTMAYRESKDARYLRKAEEIADFWILHPNLPADKVPYWDFDAPPIPDEVRDASAAAIAASALLELSAYSSEGGRYREAAIATLRTLSSEKYLAKPGTNNHFILKHSVGHKSANREVDVPLIYADYYFLEALGRVR